MNEKQFAQALREFIKSLEGFNDPAKRLAEILLASLEQKPKE